MAPDGKKAKVQSVLNRSAAKEVQEEQKSTISAVPADLDIVDLTFESEATRYVSEWLGSAGQKASQAKPFALVFSRSIDADVTLLAKAGAGTATRYQAFRNQKLIDIEGCIIVATMNLESALVMPIAAVKNSQQLIDAIASFGMEDRQIAILEPPMTNLILLRWGIHGKSRAQSVLAAGPKAPWKLAELEKEIELFHADQTRVPDAALFPWKSPAKDGRTVERLENRISKQLALYLDRPWTRGSVLSEYPSNAGRIDVFLNPHVLDSQCGPCIIEIKVLRSRSSTREKKPEFSIKWAKKGLAQAKLYREDKQAPAAYLYSFDARDKDEGIPEVDELAKKMKVEHRRLFMYRSTDELQDATLAAAEAEA